MAKMVLGIGTSHGPQLNIAPEHWSVLQEKDRTDRRFDYEQLRKSARPGLEAEIEPEVWQRRYRACMEAIGRLAEIIAQAKPDLLVVIGDDQHEQFLDDNLPMFSVFWGDRLNVTKNTFQDTSVFGSLRWHELEQQSFGDEPLSVPGQPNFALHLIEVLRHRDVDIAVSNQLKAGTGVGHAFAMIARRLMGEIKIPIVPIMLNTFYPPNQPTPRRCYQVGQMVAEAISSWPEDRRVAVIASGGLSHFLIDEALDRRFLTALAQKDTAAIVNTPEEKLRLGTSEMLCWMVAAGALEPLPMHLVAYEPCYRSLAGTGCGMAFAYWSES